MNNNTLQKYPVRQADGSIKGILASSPEEAAHKAKEQAGLTCYHVVLTDGCIEPVWAASEYEAIRKVRAMMSA